MPSSLRSGSSPTAKLRHTPRPKFIQSLIGCWPVDEIEPPNRATELAAQLRETRVLGGGRGTSAALEACDFTSHRRPRSLALSDVLRKHARRGAPRRDLFEGSG